MGVEKGWKVMPQVKAPCLFTVHLNGRRINMCIHTDDVDGICDNLDDAAEPKEEFDKKFGVTVCDPTQAS